MACVHVLEEGAERVVAEPVNLQTAFLRFDPVRLEHGFKVTTAARQDLFVGPNVTAVDSKADVGRVAIVDAQPQRLGRRLN